MNDLPSYKTNDPRGWCGDPSRGAALGRGCPHHADDKDAPVKLVLRKVRLDNGGYDSNGTYFGWGPPALYWYADSEGTIDATLRAHDRCHARQQVIDIYPNAKFYN